MDLLEKERTGGTLKVVELEPLGMSFGGPALVNTGEVYGGLVMARVAEPSEEFWRRWRADKAAMHALGYAPLRVVCPERGTRATRWVVLRHMTPYQRAPAPVPSAGAPRGYDDELARRERIRQVRESGRLRLVV
jgi:hypothetical protein